MSSKRIKSEEVKARITEEEKQKWKAYIEDSEYYDTLTDLITKSVAREMNRSSSNSASPDLDSEIQNLENKIDEINLKLNSETNKNKSIYQTETHYRIDNNYEEERNYLSKNISGKQLEKIVSELWERNGYYTKIGKQSSDKGADVIAISNHPVFRKEMIQVKNTIDKVNAHSIRDYNSAAIAHQADYCIIVTTSEFTKQAISVAEDLNVRLINGNYLCYMLEQQNLIPLLDEYE